MYSYNKEQVGKRIKSIRQQKDLLKNRLGNCLELAKEM